MLELLTDGNYVCDLCGCIVHGAFKTQHGYQHHLILLVMEHHGEEFVRRIVHEMPELKESTYKILNEISVENKS